MTRIVLAEDQRMMRGAIARLLGLEPDFDIVAQVDSGVDVLDAVRANDAEVALVDIEMPGLDGLSAAALLRDEIPDCRVIILTTFGRPGYLRRAMEAGARGFLVKDGPVEVLADAIRRVLAGEQVIDPDLAASALRSGSNPLTPRERAVLAEALHGSTVEDVAARLYLSPSTVRNYLSAAIGKTGGRNRIEAARAARDNGWL